MKKFLIVLTAALLLLTSCAFAEMPYQTGLGEGTYKVSVDLPAGLYTYTLADSESGSLSVTLEDGRSWSYQLSGPASVTVYIPNLATVDIEDGGLLTEMEESLVTWDRYSGTGRFLSGRQLIEGVEYQIRREEGAQVAFYSIGSIRSDRGLAEESRVELTDDEWQSILLPAGEFIFFTGCVLQSNG